MPLLEPEATRMAAALDDYEHVSVREVREREPGFFRIEFTDERFCCDYVISSHFDYWDFIGYLVDRKQWPVKPVRVVA
jgi:hypothetical protein